MAAEVRRESGCLAAAAIPTLLVMAPLTAVRQRAARRRRGTALRARADRSRVLGWPCVLLELDVPLARVRDLVAALASAFADAAVAASTTIGCVGIAAGEEPVLTALPPRRDAVAERVVLELTMGAAHRRPHLWLSLSPGVFLAEVVDPLSAYDPSLEGVARLLTGGRVGTAALVAVATGAISTRITLTLLGSGRTLLSLLATGRRALSSLDGWEPLES